MLAVEMQAQISENSSIIVRMDSIDKLIEHFRQFPSIGPRQARRFVYFLLTQPTSFRHALAHELTELGKHIEVCSSCYHFFPLGKSQKSAAKDTSLCAICANPDRDHSQLMIVSRDVDF